MSKTTKKIAVIGDGIWGSALAIKAARKNHEIIIYSRNYQGRFDFHPKIDQLILPPNILFYQNIDSLIDVDLVIIAIPVQNIRHFFLNLTSKIGTEVKNKHFLISSKGIENETLKLVSDIVLDFSQDHDYSNISVISGPNFAKEVIRSIPSMAILASISKDKAQELKNIFADDNFKIILSDDIRGVQICGAMKNIYAIGCGILKGLNLGENARAAFLTKAMEEMQIISSKLKGNSESALGLAGLGDLILTSCSMTSRNTKFGFDFVQNDINRPKETVEGFTTVKTIRQILKKNDFSLPLAETIYDILYQNKDCQSLIKILMS